MSTVSIESNAALWPALCMVILFRGVDSLKHGHSVGALIYFTFGGAIFPIIGIVVISRGSFIGQVICGLYLLLLLIFLLVLSRKYLKGAANKYWNKY